ncbi:hypothetical protein [Hymenobacter sp. B1770]|uniref:hypothetical protein n=1 Tax=Hymenobacter sp. B1770 TaxID=1718788 RepID=UPI003CEA33A8
MKLLTTLYNKLNFYRLHHPKKSLFLFLVLVVVGTRISNAINPHVPTKTELADAAAKADKQQAEEAEAAAKAAQPKEADANHAEYKVLRPYLRANLNDWDSYESRGVSEPQAIAAHDGQPAWRIRHTYRAKNGFNATVLNDQMFYYTKNGVYLVLDAK